MEIAALKPLPDAVKHVFRLASALAVKHGVIGVSGEPIWLQGAMQIFPTPHFVSFAQAVLYRAAGLDIVWPELLVMAIISGVYFAISGVRFRKTLVALG
jgi:hypothetical protein